MSKMKALFIAGVALVIAETAASAAPKLSPANWPAEERAAAEKAESTGMMPAESKVYVGRKGAISATASAVSVAAGLQTLDHGGNAADAATAIAMTGITMQLGTVVSYAGIMSLVYYDAKTKKVYSLDAGYNSYRGETDPESIPAADMGSVAAAARTGTAGGSNIGTAPAAAKTDFGRMTLVAGYMMGFEAMQKRFGRLAWADLFAPAIWYAQKGVVVNPSLFAFFDWRKSFLERTPEGKAFLHPGDAALPGIGERFYQPETAKTLRAVAQHGAKYMYSGAWADEFVRIVSREGGKVTKADLADYRPVWAEPFSTTFAGTTIYAPGGENWAGYNIIPSINVAEALKLDQRPPFWADPDTFVAVSRVAGAMEIAPILTPTVNAALDEAGIDHSRSALLGKEFAARVAPLIDKIGQTSAGDGSHHSNSIVVVDAEGNVAAVTHTINSVVWGSTGIVVGGIPIPDSAGFQQKMLATVKPGTKVPNVMVQTVVLKDGKPVFATAGIGSALVPESLKLLLSVVGQKQSLADVQAAPPLMNNFPIAGMTGTGATLRDVVVPEGAYDKAFLAKVESAGMKVTAIPAGTAAGFRGTVAAVSIDPATGVRQATDTKGVLLFGGAR